MATKKIDAKATREKLKLNQQTFWGALGVTQSGGSRYESTRRIPKPVRMLIEIAYGKASAEDIKTGKLASRV